MTEINSVGEDDEENDDSGNVNMEEIIVQKGTVTEERKVEDEVFEQGQRTERGKRQTAEIRGNRGCRNSSFIFRISLSIDD